MGADRTTQSQVSVPFQQSLVTGLALAMLIALGTLGARRWMGLPYDWVEVGIAAVGAGALGFCGTWLLLLYALWPRPLPPQSPRLEVLMPVARPAFSARDALRFVQDALILVDGVWQDKAGGSSQRKMEEKGWPREEWDLAVAWLLEHGILEWRNEDAHQQGTRWNWAALDKFVGRGV